MGLSRIHFNREINALEYERFPKIKPSLLDVIMSLIGYPAGILLGATVGAIESYKYFKYQRKQVKLLRILNDAPSLQQYKASRVQALDEKIARLKRRAEEHIQIVRHTGCLKEGELPLSTRAWTNEHWKDFGTTDILALAGKQLPTKVNAFALNMENFIYCDAYRRRIGALMAQKELFQKSPLEGEEGIARKIAEMSYIKTLFKKQSSLSQLRSFKWLFIPFGLLCVPTRSAAPYLVIRHHGFQDKEVFNNRSTDLSLVPSLKEKGPDLVDTHNQLLKESAYLMPYIP